MQVLVATIEHSGTHALLELLGWPKRHTVTLSERQRATPDSILHMHLWPHAMPSILEAAKTIPVVTTDRPIEDIRASWRRRGKDLSLLAAQIACWDELYETCRPSVLELGRRWLPNPTGC
ncbi:MAG TPA: hypothetical protein VFA39_15680 [Steroidobacteraceae bacterium]|nr:hypothetical protein [Steroidobacteraceae bacterium]